MVTGTLLDLRNTATTGSISAGSKKLTVASTAGFAVGDCIIIEIGTEAGQGRRGTVGVGGVWPALSYASAAERQRADPPELNTYAYDRDTKLVWQWLGTAWDGAVTQWTYYSAQAVPRSLCATIVSKSGSTFTLDKPAVETATDANVYYDNAARFWWEIGNEESGFVPDGNTLVIPEGKFAFSSPLKIRQHAGWTLTGQGETSVIFAPKGVWGANVQVQSCDGMVLENFNLLSNGKNHGFGLAWNTLDSKEPVVDETHLPQGASYPAGAQLLSCTGGVIRNITATDVLQCAMGTSYCADVEISNCRVHVTDPHRAYVQWQYLVSDSTNVSVHDCELEAATLEPGYGHFLSKDLKLERCNSINGVYSYNSCGRWHMTDCNITIRAMSQFDAAFSSKQPIVAVTTNQQPPIAEVADGGLCENFSIVQEGPVNAAGDILYGISVDANNPNVVIRGGYPDHPDAGGLIAFPDYSGTGWPGSQIVADEAVITVEGMRVTGATAYQIVCHAPSTVSNCVVDTLSADAVASGNITNAEWEALGPPIPSGSVDIVITSSAGVRVTINGVVLTG